MEDQKVILVTGGAGFIGSHLCEALLKEGNEVLCLDNFCDFYNPEVKRNNVKALLNSSSFTLIEGDIRDKALLDRLFSGKPIDLVVHLAAMAGVRPSIEDPELYYDVNVTGTLLLLQACHEHNVNKIIFASSSSVYGNNPVPFKESDSVDNPISPYAATKKAGELLCYTYHHLFAMSIMCLRFFTVYGPRQRPDLAICKFVKSIESGVAIDLFGDGSNSRDYTFIDDIIHGLKQSIGVVSSTQQAVYEVVNLGNSTPCSLIDMVKTIETTLGKKAIVNWCPMQPGDVDRTYADISKAKQLLDFNPQTSFLKGIGRFVEWFHREGNEWL